MGNFQQSIFLTTRYCQHTSNYVKKRISTYFESERKEKRLNSI